MDPSTGPCASLQPSSCLWQMRLDTLRFKTAIMGVTTMGMEKLSFVMQKISRFQADVAPGQSGYTTQNVSLGSCGRDLC